MPFGLLVRTGGGALESGRYWQPVVSCHSDFFCQLFNLVLVTEKLSGLTLGGIFFLTPLFGVLFGVWLLGEQLEHSFIMGAILVMLGVVMVSAQGWFKRRVA
ncbi:EamA family transporter [Acinetobacter indicus]|uniref:EamA family transporter n=1 Tax=Acinetobacter indicus TaxID=756892 RepID=UPI003F6889B2